MLILVELLVRAQAQEQVLALVPPLALALVLPVLCSCGPCRIVVDEEGVSLAAGRSLASAASSSFCCRSLCARVDWASFKLRANIARDAEKENS